MQCIYNSCYNAIIRKSRERDCCNNVIKMEKPNREGWVSIHRQIRKHPLWTMERFTYGQAWVDLILRANHCSRNITYNGKIVTIERGNMLTSKVKLADEWQWNVKTVNKYLKRLQNLKMIRVKSDKSGTWIYITNYDKYQSSEEKTVENPTVIPVENPRDTNNTANTLNTFNKKRGISGLKNSFNSFKQNDYDFKALEDILLRRK